MNDTSTEGTPFENPRVTRSRTTMVSTAPKANSAWTSNPSVPGRTMIITPTKPSSSASPRRQPTASPRNSAAPSVTASGIACRIAVALAIGMLNSAERNR